MKMKTIRIDEEVWRALQKKGTPFEDTPNDVLRRVLRVADNKLRSVQRRTRARAGAKTPEHAYRKPILKALYEMGGSARAADVLARIEQMLRRELNQTDREPTSSGAIRWRNSAQWARNALVAAGLLKSNSAHGVWELSSKGIAEVESLE